MKLDTVLPPPHGAVTPSRYTLATGHHPPVAGHQMTTDRSSLNHRQISEDVGGSMDLSIFQHMYLQIETSPCLVLQERGVRREGHGYSLSYISTTRVLLWRVIVSTRLEAIYQPRHCSVTFAACVCSKFLQLTRGARRRWPSLVGMMVVVFRYGVCLFRYR